MKQQFWKMAFRRQCSLRSTDQGFHESLIHKGGGIGQAAGPVGNTYFDPILEHNNVSKKHKGYCDDIFTDAALDFIGKNKDKPLFAYIATNLPHLPLQVPDERAEPYRIQGLHEDNALLYGMIDNVDYNVGHVLDKLKELGIEDNTIVIFLSENGPRHKRTKNDSYPGRYVANLRGTKTNVYENGVRVKSGTSVDNINDFVKFWNRFTSQYFWRAKLF